MHWIYLRKRQHEEKLNSKTLNYVHCMVAPLHTFAHMHICVLACVQDTCSCTCNNNVCTYAPVHACMCI
eukprot:c38118_g1_i1 orf=53-259(+)